MHFPEQVRSLPIFDGPFEAFKLEAKACDVLFASYSARTMIEPHTHDTANIGVIIQGALILVMNGQKTRHQVGDWYYAPPQTSHAAYFEEATSAIEFWFHVD